MPLCQDLQTRTVLVNVLMKPQPISWSRRRLSARLCDFDYDSKLRRTVLVIVITKPQPITWSRCR